MEPEYDEMTKAARAQFTDPYDRECFDYGFHAGWHGGGEPGDGQDGKAWDCGEQRGWSQRNGM